MTDSPSPTWALLLAKWTEFARASVAFPKTDEGDRWRNAVAPIISLQAVTFALAEVHELEHDERALALDRADIAICKAAGELHELWRGEPLPDELILLTEDARSALLGATQAGLEWTVAAEALDIDHPAPLAAALAASGFDGDLFLPIPAVPVYQTSPAAFVRTAGGGIPDDEVVELIWSFLGPGAAPPQPVPTLRQVYRQFDFGMGRAVRDAVHTLDDTLPAGQPLLVPVLIGGVLQTVPMHPKINLHEPLPVVFVDEPGEADPSEHPPSAAG